MTPTEPCSSSTVSSYVDGTSAVFGRKSSRSHSGVCDPAWHRNCPNVYRQRKKWRESKEQTGTAATTTGCGPRDATPQTILVYDVSRWGRFQDTDEPAHYEFLCKSAGVPIHYCAETFANDGTFAGLIMKTLKRTMAGEYSRELGVRILAGQKRLADLGFKQGGRPVTAYDGCSSRRIECQNKSSNLVNEKA